MASASRDWNSEQGGHQQRRSRSLAPTEAPEADTWHPSPRTPSSEPNEPWPEPKEHQQSKLRGIWSINPNVKGVFESLSGEQKKPSKGRKGPLKSFFESLLALAVSLFILWTFFLCPHHHDDHTHHDTHLPHGSASATPDGAPGSNPATAATRAATGAATITGGVAGAVPGRSVHEEDVVRALEGLSSGPLHTLHDKAPHDDALHGKALHDEGRHSTGILGGPLRDAHSGAHDLVMESHSFTPEEEPAGPFTGPSLDIDGTPLAREGLLIGSSLGSFLSALGWGWGAHSADGAPKVHHSLHQSQHGTPGVHHTLRHGLHPSAQAAGAVPQAMGRSDFADPLPPSHLARQSGENIEQMAFSAEGIHRHTEAGPLEPGTDAPDLRHGSGEGQGGGSLAFTSNTNSDEDAYTSSMGEYLRSWMRGPWGREGSPAAHPGRASRRRRASNRTRVSTMRLCDLLGEGFFAPSPQLPRHLVTHTRGGRGRCGVRNGVPGVGVGVLAASEEWHTLVGAGATVSVTPGKPGVTLREANSADGGVGQQDSPGAREEGSGMSRVQFKSEVSRVEFEAGTKLEAGAEQGFEAGMETGTDAAAEAGTESAAGTETGALEVAEGEAGTGAAAAASAETAAAEVAEGETGTEGDVKQDLICLAIPSVPRGTKEHETAVVAVELIKALSDRRITSVPVHYSFVAVVYSAGCYTPSEEAYTEGVLAAHREDLMRAAQYAARVGGQGHNKSLSVSVVGAPRELCEVMASPDVLLDGMPENQTEGHWLWRTKETIDFAYVIRQCLAMGPAYVVFLEDDTWPVMGYDYGIQQVLDSGLQGKQWHAVSLYFPSSNAWRHRHLASNYTFPCCTQAILLPHGEARSLVEYVEDHFIAKPVDWLIRDYLKKTDHIGLAHIPSLFQHQITIPSSNRWRHTSARFHKDLAFTDSYVARKYHVKV